MIYPGSVADENGLKVGDCIEAVNGEIVFEVIKFKDALGSVLAGGKIHLLVLRNKIKFHIDLPLKEVKLDFANWLKNDKFPQFKLHTC
jgi:C-terminal processing protease CtpA/Prc